MLEQNTEKLNFDAFKIKPDTNQSDSNLGLEMPKLREEPKLSEESKTFNLYTPSLNIEIEENKVTVKPDLITDYTIQFENIKDWEKFKNVAREIADFDYSPMDFTFDNLKTMQEKLRQFSYLQKTIIPNLTITSKHDPSKKIRL